MRPIDTSQGTVLLRSDGLMVAISEPIRELLREIGHLSEPDGYHWLERRYGGQVARECLAEIRELAAAGVLDGHPSTSHLTVSESDTVEPSGILLMVSQTCNLACKYCYAGGGSYGSPVSLMSPELGKKAIDLLMKRAPRKGQYTVIFFGGEPLLNFGLIQRVVAYCLRRSDERNDHPRFRFSMTTNGTVLSEEILEFLKQHSFTLMVSFDGKGFHAENRPFRNGRSSEELVLRNIKRLTEAGIPVQLRATLLPEMVEEEVISDLIGVGKALGVGRIFTAPADHAAPADCGLGEEPVAGCGTADLVRLEEVYAALTQRNLDEAASEDGRILYDPHVSMMKALATGRAVGSRKCGACFSMAAVSTDGTIYPCHRFVGMRPYSIGSVEEGVDHEKVRHFFSSVEEAYGSQCSSCWAQDLCGGVCYHHRADGLGGFEAPEHQDCRSFRQSVEKSVGFLVDMASMTPETRESYMRRVRHF